MYVRETKVTAMWACPPEFSFQWGTLCGEALVVQRVPVAKAGADSDLVQERVSVGR